VGYVEKKTQDPPSLHGGCSRPEGVSHSASTKPLALHCVASSTVVLLPWLVKV
jgi:hypothetical protein